MKGWYLCWRRHTRNETPRLDQKVLFRENAWLTEYIPSLAARNERPNFRTNLNMLTRIPTARAHKFPRAKPHFLFRCAKVKTPWPLTLPAKNQCPINLYWTELSLKKISNWCLTFSLFDVTKGCNFPSFLSCVGCSSAQARDTSFSQEPTHEKTAPIDGIRQWSKMSKMTVKITSSTLAVPNSQFEPKLEEKTEKCTILKIFLGSWVNKVPPLGPAAGYTCTYCFQCDGCTGAGQDPGCQGQGQDVGHRRRECRSASDGCHCDLKTRHSCSAFKSPTSSMCLHPHPDSYIPEWQPKLKRSHKGDECRMKLDFFLSRSAMNHEKALVVHWWHTRVKNLQHMFSSTPRATSQSHSWSWRYSTKQTERMCTECETDFS